MVDECVNNFGFNDPLSLLFFVKKQNNYNYFFKLEKKMKRKTIDLLNFERNRKNQRVPSSKVNLPKIILLKKYCMIFSEK
mgnify:CR=1 FL=1